MKNVFFAIAMLAISLSTLQAQDVDGTIGQANKKIEAGQYKEAKSLLDELIAKGGSTKEAYYHRAIAKANLQDFEGAVEDLQEALAQDKTEYQYYYYRAYCNLQLENYQQAISDCDKSLALNADKNPESFLVRGQAKINLSEGAGACEDLVKAKEAGNKEAEKLCSIYCK